MDAFRELLACPACAGALTADWSCAGCGARFAAPDGIPNLRVADAPDNVADARTDAVRRFYEAAPFPGYPPRDSLHALRARAGRSAFARLLDRAIAGDARIVEVGCGTGQMCLYLARADRVVVGADLTRASLTLAANAARRFGIDRVQFVETDLRRPGLTAGSFDVVFSRRCRAPYAGSAGVVRAARPAGASWWNYRARGLQRVRAHPVAASTGRGTPLGFHGRPVRSGPARSHARARAPRRVAARSVSTSRRASPHAGRGAGLVCRERRPVPARLSERGARRRAGGSCSCNSAVDNWRVEGWLAQLGWIATLGHEGGLFFTIGRLPQLPAGREK